MPSDLGDRGIHCTFLRAKLLPLLLGEGLPQFVAPPATDRGAARQCAIVSAGTRDAMNRSAGCITPAEPAPDRGFEMIWPLSADYLRSRIHYIIVMNYHPPISTIEYEIETCFLWPAS